MQRHRRFFAALLAALLGGVLITATATATAAPPGPPVPPSPAARHTPPTPPDQAAVTVIEGAVQRLLITPYGEPNGLRLDNGVVVLLPPHLALRLTGAVAVGDRVRAIGQPVADGAMRAQALVNLASGGALDQHAEGGPPIAPAAPAAPVAPPAPRAPLQRYTVRGIIDAVLHGPRGEANGVILVDGTLVYFRPDLVGARLAPGQPFAAAGIGTRSAAGLAIEAISARTGASAHSNFNPDQFEP